jgi:hypothetical protein
LRRLRAIYAPSHVSHSTATIAAQCLFKEGRFSYPTRNSTSIPLSHTNRRTHDVERICSLLSIALITIASPSFSQHNKLNHRRGLERVVCVVPMIGAGAFEDPRRPAYALLPGKSHGKTSWRIPIRSVTTGRTPSLSTLRPTVTVVVTDPYGPEQTEKE